MLFLPSRFSQVLSTLAVLALTLLLTATPASAQGLWRGNIIPQEIANSRGLQRQWTNQIQIDTNRDRVSSVIVDRGVVFTVTENGAMQATDAETGVTIWAESIESRGKLVQGLSASQYYVGFTCGSRLYILNRATGRVLMDESIPSIPSDGLVIGEQRAYVPCVGGLIYIYDLKPMEDPLAEFGMSDSMLSERDRQKRHQEFINSLRLVRMNREPVSVRAIGDLNVSPIVTRCNDNFEFIAWPTAIRLLTLCEVDIRNPITVVDEEYNMPLLGDVEDSLGYVPPDKANKTDGLLLAGTDEGFVYAVYESKGTVAWRFPTGEAVFQTPVCVDGEVFIITAISGMFCVDAQTGGDGLSTEAKWWSPDIKKFVSCSRNKVYAIDRMGDLVALDRMSGQKVASLPASSFAFVVTNTQSDRVFLATETGLLQCLREIALDQPVDHSALMLQARAFVEEKQIFDQAEKPKPERSAFGGDDDEPEEDDGGMGFGDEFGDEEEEEEEEFGDEFGEEEEGEEFGDEFGEEEGEEFGEEEFGDDEFGA